MAIQDEPVDSRDQGGDALWRRPGVKIAGLVVLLVLVGLAVVRARSSNHTSVSPSGHKVEVAGSGGAKVGELAPSISVPTLSGSTFAVPSGKPTAVWFTANGCTSCIPKAKALGKIKRDVGDRIAVLGVDISPTDSEGDFRDWITTVGNPAFEFTMDRGGKLALAWDVRETSTVVIVDKEGRVVYRSTGAADEAAFRSALAKAGLA